MARATRVFRNLYRDSVSLMQLSAKLGALAGVRQASAIMATPATTTSATTIRPATTITATATGSSAS